MGCVTSIAIALWLIAFAAGVLLLYKVQKENLQWPFKVAAWMIVIVAIGGMLCCSLRCLVNSCHDGNCGRPPMMYHHGMMWQGRCGESEHACGGRCEREKSNCCKDDDECDDEEHEKEIRVLIHSDSADVK